MDSHNEYGPHNEIGTHDDKIDILVLDLYSYSEQISDKLQKIKKEIQNSSGYFNGKNGNALRKKIEEQCEYFSTIKSNIQKLVDILLETKESNISFDKMMNRKMKQESTEIDIFKEEV